MELDEVTSFGRLLAAAQHEQDIAHATVIHPREEQRQNSVARERPTEFIELQPVRTISRQIVESGKDYGSDTASSVDADDFLRPPEDDPTDEDGPDEQPRAISPERLARRKARKRAESAASQLARDRRKNRAGRLFKKLKKKARGSEAGSDSDSSGSSSSSSSRSSKAPSGISSASRLSTRSRSLWRFWRSASDASSSTRQSSDSESSDDDFERPDPSYTLMVPNLHSPSITPNYAEAYTLSTEPKLAPVLTELRAFWKGRTAPEGFSGDLGISGEPEIVITQPLDHPVASTSREAYAGPAWWLDVTCPTAQDMRALRKSLALHPLTIEDILHQDPHEKYEVFDRLGYEFVCIRALDDKYFRYEDPAGVDGIKPPVSRGGMRTDQLGKNVAQDHSQRDLFHSTTAKNRLQRPKLKIVEGVGGKEGVEGVGVGAIELYLVIYDDGILSFHMESLDKHIDRVRTKMQQLAHSSTRAISSHWIAYGLIDSIVDAFFPLLNYIEGEYGDIDAFLADPLADRADEDGFLRTKPSKLPVTASRHIEITKTLTWFSLPGLRFVSLPAFVLARLPKWLVHRHSKATTSEFVLEKQSLRKANRQKRQRKVGQAIGENLGYKPSRLLKQIAISRQLVTGLSRLMLPKRDMIRGLRKRHQTLGDIAVYWGDLYDHVLAMQQSLTFYEVILAHDHPVLVGLFRLALCNTKNHTDKLISRVYVVTAAFLLFNLITGAFSLNVSIPHNGDAETKLEPDGSVPPKIVFGIIIAAVAVAAMAFGTFVRYQFKHMRRQSDRLAAL